MPFITARILSVIVDDTVQALAEAGENQSVLCTAVVTLEGEILLDDIANHTFEWEQSSGTPVILINPDTLTPSFTNPLLSDLEFTLYVDRNTPFEDSDVVLVTRQPQDSATTSIANTARTNVSVVGAGPAQIQTSAYFSADATVVPLAFTKPAATYSPLYTADDVDRIRQWPAANYQLMNDIDLSSYSNWNPISTSNKPFTGDFQGNGFVIDNLTINTGAISRYDSYTADPDFASVILLLPMIGIDGDTTTTDVSNDNRTATFYNNAQISDSQAAWSGTSLLLDGVDDAISFPTTIDWIPDVEYTVEGWMYVNGIGAEGETIVSWRNTTPTQTGYILLITATGFLAVTGWNSGGTIIINFAGTTQYTEKTWQHFAMTRDNVGDWRLFLDGNLEATVAETGTIGNNALQPLFLGRDVSLSGVDRDWDGFLQDIRITRGVCRYTTSFTPPEFHYRIPVFKDSGLFSNLGAGAIVEEVGVTNATISGLSSSTYKGILAGTASGAVTVRNCYVEGTVDSSGDLAGGLIGNTGTNASSIYDNTYVDVTVTGGGTDTGGWAGTFDGSPTYTENYSNTTKTAAVVGTGSPGGAEVSGLTAAQLNAEANYTDWDFTSTWEIAEGVSPATLQNDPRLRARVLSTTCDRSMLRYDAEADQPLGNTIPGFFVPGQHIGYIYKFVGVRTERLEGTSWVHDAFTPAVQRYVPIKDGKALRGYWRWQKTMNGRVLETIETLHPKSFGSKFGGLDAPGGSDIASASLASSQSDQSYNLVITISNPRKIAKAEADIIATSFGSTERSEVSLTALSRFIAIAKEPTIPVGENVVTSGGFGNSFKTEITGLVIVRNEGVGIG